LNNISSSSSSGNGVGSASSSSTTSSESTSSSTASDSDLSSPRRHLGSIPDEVILIFGSIIPLLVLSMLFFWYRDKRINEIERQRQARLIARKHSANSVQSVSQISAARRGQRSITMHEKIQAMQEADEADELHAAQKGATHTHSDGQTQQKRLSQKKTSHMGSMNSSKDGSADHFLQPSASSNMGKEGWWKTAGTKCQLRTSVVNPDSSSATPGDTASSPTLSWKDAAVKEYNADTDEVVLEITEGGGEEGGESGTVQKTEVRIQGGARITQKLRLPQE